MIKRLARFFLEPFAKVFRKFFDPRFYKLEYAADQTGQAVGAIEQAIRAESAAANAREAALRDAVTLIGTKITRIESSLAAIEGGLRDQGLRQLSQQAYLEDQQTKLDAQHAYLENQQARFDTQQTYLEDQQTKLDAQHAYLENQQAKLDAQQTYLEDHQTKLDTVQADLAAIRPRIENLPRVLQTPDTPDDVSPVDADLLNYAESHRGFRSQAGLWFNPPDVVQYMPGGVQLSAITERSVEVPFVLSTLASRLPRGATVFDVGCAESLVPLELASLGYAVTGIDLRPYPLSHPNLETYDTPLQNWESSARFDAVVCLSSIEHFGLGTYGEVDTDESLDKQAMAQLLEMIEPEGFLVLTIPFGEPTVTDVQRTYDREALDRLLEGWSVDSIEVATRADDGWVVLDEIPEPAPLSDPPMTNQVALIIAHPDA